MHSDTATRLRVEEPMLTGADLVARYGLTPDALLSSRRVFSFVTRTGQRLYPEVQFTPFGPLEAVAEIIEALGPRAESQAEICAWFYESRAEFGGLTAADMLNENADAVHALALGHTDAVIRSA